jgi:hypothetical protein
MENPTGLCRSLSERNAILVFLIHLGPDKIRKSPKSQHVYIVTILPNVPRYWEGLGSYIHSYPFYIPMIMKLTDHCPGPIISHITVLYVDLVTNGSMIWIDLRYDHF